MDSRRDPIIRTNTSILMGEIIGGAAQAVGSIVGSRGRKREQKAAQQEFDAAKQAYQSFQFTNPYKNLENTAEDLTVNQQASNFQAQQSDQALANAQQSIVEAGGGGGDAAALVAGALQSKQNISADLAGQEQANQRARAQQAAQNQQLEAQGESALQQQQYAQQGEILDLAGSRLGAANAARQKATSDLIGGLGSVAGGIASGGLGDLGNLFGTKTETA